MEADHSSGPAVASSSQPTEPAWPWFAAFLGIAQAVATAVWWAGPAIGPTDAASTTLGYPLALAVGWAAAFGLGAYALARASLNQQLGMLLCGVAVVMVQAALAPADRAGDVWAVAVFFGIGVWLGALGVRSGVRHPALQSLSLQALWVARAGAGPAVVSAAAAGLWLYLQGAAPPVLALSLGPCGVLGAWGWWPVVWRAQELPERRRAAQEAHDALAAAQLAARRLVQELPALVYVVDAQGRVQQASLRWLAALGFRESDVVGRPLTDLITTQSAVLAAGLCSPLAPRDAMDEGVPVQWRRHDGSVLDSVVTAHWDRDAQGRALRGIGVVEDVAERKLLLARSYFAEHDPLTGLPNRVLLDDRLRSACLLAHRTGMGFGVGFLDLDRFKDINDHYGHEAGDELLREVARRLLGGVREVDTVSRLAGDEFVLVLQGLGDARFAQQTGRRLMEQLTRAPVALAGPDGQTTMVQLGASLGLALYGPSVREPQALLQRADEAMYRAKRQGHNAVVCEAEGL